MARPSRTGGKTRAAKTRKAGSVKGRSITVLVLTATINLISAMKAQALLAGRGLPQSAGRKHGHYSRLMLQALVAGTAQWALQSPPFCLKKWFSILQNGGADALRTIHRPPICVANARRLDATQR